LSIWASYSINKVDFLEIYQEARELALTPENIQSAWKNSSLLPLDPEVILKQLHESKDTQTAQPTTLSSSNSSISRTPVGVKGVEKILKQARDGELQSPIKFLEKASKVAIKALTDSHIQNATNNELLESQRRLKSRGNRATTNLGRACVMDRLVLEQRQNIDFQKEYTMAIKWLHSLNLSIFDFKLTPEASSVKPPNKANQRVFNAAFKTICQPCTRAFPTRHIRSSQRPSSVLDGWVKTRGSAWATLLTS
jgi:hypothetical protein